MDEIFQTGISKKLSGKENCEKIAIFFLLNFILDTFLQKYSNSLCYVDCSLHYDESIQLFNGCEWNTSFNQPEAGTILRGFFPRETVSV